MQVERRVSDTENASVGRQAVKIAQQFLLRPKSMADTESGEESPERVFGVGHS